jgi:hypothetical protein
MPRAIRSSAPALDPTTLWQRDSLRACRLKIPPDRSHSSPCSCSLARLSIVDRLAVHSDVTFISHVPPERINN